MKFDVIGFGALNVDLLYNVNKITHEDEEAFITDFNIYCGGSAANTIIGLSKLDLKTGYIGKVAQDRYGKILMENLQRENVDTSGIIVEEKGRSGNVLGFVDRKGNRALYVDPGVNDLIDISEVNLGYIENSRVLHLTSFVGDSIKAQELILDSISDEIIVSLDPGRIYAERGNSFVEKILKRTDIILINEEELKYLTGNKYKSLEEMVKNLKEYDIDKIIVKRGEKGSYITDHEESHYLKPFDVICKDTTGAGDAFNAGFLYGFLRSENLKKCGEIGNYVASCCIQESGSLNGLPKLSDLID